MNAYVIPGLKFKHLIPMGTATPKLTFQRIIDIVLEGTGKEEEDLIDKSRKREVTGLRQICMWAIRYNTSATLKSIGDHFGGRDHTSVIHSCQKINDLIDIKDPEVTGIIARIKVYI